MSNQAGNAIDEWVTDALRNNLVGLPLDLATLNIVRGRDTGLGSLNQVRAENVRNNCAKKVKTATADLAEGAEITSEAMAALSAEVAAYDSAYVFNMATVSAAARVVDPVEREAIKLARANVTALLKEKGLLY